MTSLIEYTEIYRTMAHDWIKLRGHDLADVTTGSDAWRVAHGAGISSHAYNQSRDVTDAHIKTVLQRIMPNAVFADKYRY